MVAHEPMPMPEATIRIAEKVEIVVIGAGQAGLSSAYHLKRLGYGDVTIFEKDTIGAGSSSRAAGSSHWRYSTL